MKRKLLRMVGICLLLGAVLSVQVAPSASAAGTSMPTAPCPGWTAWTPTTLSVYDQYSGGTIGMLIGLKDQCNNKVAFGIISNGPPGTITVGLTGPGGYYYITTSPPDTSTWYSDVVSSIYTQACVTIQIPSIGKYGTTCYP